MLNGIKKVLAAFSKILPWRKRRETILSVVTFSDEMKSLDNLIPRGPASRSGDKFDHAGKMRQRRNRRIAKGTATLVPDGMQVKIGEIYHVRTFNNWLRKAKITGIEKNGVMVGTPLVSQEGTALEAFAIKAILKKIN